MKTAQIPYDLFLDLAMYRGVRMVTKKKSVRTWSRSSMPCWTGSSIPGTKQLRPKKNGSRRGRNTLTGAAFRRAIAGLFLRGSCDRSVPRSCGWQTRKRIGCYPLASPSPSKNPQSLRWMWAEDYAQRTPANKLLTTPVFAVCIHTASRKTGRGIRRCRIPPRRAHDTLQPQDESIIVGYYTSAEVLPQSYPSCTI